MPSSQPTTLVPTHGRELGSASSHTGLGGGEAGGADALRPGQTPGRGNTIPHPQGWELSRLVLPGRMGIGLGPSWPIPKPGCNSHW